MIVSVLFEDKERAEFDSQVLKLKVKPGSFKDVQDERMQVGIRNSKGEIYRAMGVTGINTYLRVVKKLSDIGLVDELKGQIKPKGGFDNIFSAQTPAAG